MKKPLLPSPKQDACTPKANEQRWKRPFCGGDHKVEKFSVYTAKNGSVFIVRGVFAGLLV